MNILIALALLIVLAPGESEMLREQRELHEVRECAREQAQRQWHEYWEEMNAEIMRRSNETVVNF